MVYLEARGAGGIWTGWQVHTYVLHTFTTPCRRPCHIPQAPSAIRPMLIPPHYYGKVLDAPPQLIHDKQASTGGTLTRCA